MVGVGLLQHGERLAIVRGDHADDAVGLGGALGLGEEGQGHPGLEVPGLVALAVLVSGAAAGEQSPVAIGEVDGVPDAAADGGGQLAALDDVVVEGLVLGGVEALADIEALDDDEAIEVEVDEVAAALGEVLEFGGLLHDGRGKFLDR